MSKLRNCKIGISCGYSCISSKKKCSEKCSAVSNKLLEQMQSLVTLPSDPYSEDREAFSFLKSQGLAKYVDLDREDRWPGEIRRTPGEEMLSEYTSVVGIYQRLNKALREGSDTEEKTRGWQSVEKSLNKQLDLEAENTHAKLYRYSDLSPEAIKQYQRAFSSVDAQIEEKGFVSTSYGELNSKFEGNTVYEITPKLGKDSNAKDLKTSEREVLFKSRTKFEVTGFEPQWDERSGTYDSWVIKLREI